MSNLSLEKDIIILKNDAVGDLTQSLKAINNIVMNNKDSKITIFLSERSEKFSFLINEKNVFFKKLNYDLTLIEKLKLIFYIISRDISKIYILTPKNFYYYLPILFKKIKFYALCINGPNNYKRPNEKLRKYLYKYVINHRDAIFKRKSTIKIQSDLTEGNIKNNNIYQFKSKLIISKKLKEKLPKNYIYFHIKKKTINKLNWGASEIKYLFSYLLEHYQNIIFTKDIDNHSETQNLYEEFGLLDFSNNKFIDRENKIFLFDKIKGEDLYNTIKHASKVMAFHGMMTNLASIEKRPVIDLWYCNIKNWNDYRNYRNAFYEFKPNYKDYNFIIPNNNIKKTVAKLKFCIK